MADYIRGKKAYTKWDVDAENVDLDLRPENHQPRVQVNSPGWFSGIKGKVLKVLFAIIVLLVGLIIGYLVRRGVHEGVFHKDKTKCPLPSGIFAFKNKYAQLLQNAVDSKNIDFWVRNFSSEVHRAGSDKGKQLAEVIQDQWQKFGLGSVWLEKFLVTLSYPSSEKPNIVRKVRSNGSTIFVASEVGDDVMMPEARPYSAYSPNRTVQGKPVYAHYGRPEDFEELLKNNISLTGTILIMRNGRVHRGNKIRLATRHGAAAVLLYPDPVDAVPDGVKVFPNGVGLPGDGVVRGNLKLYPGDPATPHLPSSAGMYRIPKALLDLPSIPVHPINYNDAQVLLSDMDGPVVPESWNGGLNITYHLGPGYSSENSNSEVEVGVYTELHEKEIFNVLASIPGKFEPGRYVIVGCHHDSWTSGGSDPGTGSSVLMELARVFGLMRKNGWQPGRTLVLASWDAEEFGMIGSTEWATAHAKELAHRAVAYINIDAAVTGNHSLVALASPLLQQALYEATSLVPCHETTHSDMTVYDMWKVRQPRNRNDPKSEPQLEILGSGSDFVSFMAGLGISSVHLQFVGKDMMSDYPLYHSSYDKYDAVANFTDQNFTVSKTMAQVVGILALKLTDSLLLPLRASHYSYRLKEDVTLFLDNYRLLLSEHGIDIELLTKTVDDFDIACKKFHNNFQNVDQHNQLLALREYNDRLLELERAFLLPEGVTLDSCCRHAIYGPSVSDNYKGDIFPHLVAAIKNAKEMNATASWKTVEEHFSYVIYALQSAGGVLNSEVLLGPKREL